MSMYGSVTDVQVYSRELTDLEMEGMTGCRWLGGSLGWNNSEFPTELSSLETSSAGRVGAGTSPLPGTPQKWKYSILRGMFVLILR